MNEYDDLKKLFNAITTKKKVGQNSLTENPVMN